MIRDVDFDDSPMRPGERRGMIVHSSSGLVSIRIRCFVGKPPPGGFRPCPECGTIQARSGQEVEIIAGSRLSEDNDGSVEIDIQDVDGDRRHLTIGIAPDQTPMPAPA